MHLVEGSCAQPIPEATAGAPVSPMQYTAGYKRVKTSSSAQKAQGMGCSDNSCQGGLEQKCLLDLHFNGGYVLISLS